MSTSLSRMGRRGGPVGRSNRAGWVKSSASQVIGRAYDSSGDRRSGDTKAGSGRGEVESRVPDDLPEVAVGVLEVARINAPRPVVGRVGDGGPGRPGLGDDLVDLGPAVDYVPDAELSGSPCGQRNESVLGQLGAGIDRQHEP